MTQRTLRDAASQLEALAEILAAPTHTALVTELDQARTAAEAVAERACQSRLAQADDLADRVRDGQRDLTEAFRSIADRASRADESASQLAQELDRLKSTQRALAQQTAEIGRTVDHLRTIHSDPIGWVDTTLYETYPAIRPTFSF